MKATIGPLRTHRLRPSGDPHGPMARTATVVAHPAGLPGRRLLERLQQQLPAAQSRLCEHHHAVEPFRVALCLLLIVGRDLCDSVCRQVSRDRETVATALTDEPLVLECLHDSTQLACGDRGGAL